MPKLLETLPKLHQNTRLPSFWFLGVEHFHPSVLQSFLRFATEIVPKTSHDLLVPTDTRDDPVLDTMMMYVLTTGYGVFKHFRKNKNPSKIE